ncbi:MAG: 2,3-bisphosphoglycerate-dependent phosphoglycerate mutase [candidate division WWE3 bacterium GW2011_GWF2_41_45]|uniref:phosphoglycerate mutase (2,3-diphosphoglycerate-dependent) n=3 Tax=Katanobacteria TaxID=422282 RepID=A0A1F4VZJ9_UNCKA|nr:MAG: 2,3-bisphosphoglycerate-dependent phosphoglycerate mutase [candidate division WWE3 bacterium GW2011_GWC2_41_23]KKS10085.1 MAG: 2,3-bisphosphoglycerate-dependent phosphoglycerate mutase [candidate division WWE3 bacterium GW2011_GWF2_41_45]KKS12186.1 MAG: 2,3-bisphosphoglycerate-dependent phosphoglycerate mutase [candidate division WWE3 bacterium GW2011_GWF1_41_53]KKS27536.1 MAG: putative 2,3-bisphosphoglycerate-dependent phosphoglycerate mutase [candidate division WWE3 bacterium GW2011_GW
MIDTALLNDYYKKYGKKKVDEALSLLNYKSADVMPKNEARDKPVMYIFRHGQTEDNANFVFSGWRDSALTDKGKEQALELAEKIKDKKIHMLISSPQIRAVDTMKIAFSHNKKAALLEINTDERIKERSYGVLQGKSKLEIQLEDPKLSLKIRRSFDYQPDEGESIKMVCERVKAFCDEMVPLMKQHKINIAVSCHGNSIRGFRKYFENLSDEETATVETPLAKDYAAYTIE